MTIEEGLRTKLAATAAITNIVSTRIYPGILPQNPTYPAITYQRVSGFRLHHLGGAAGRGEPRIQIDCFASTYAGVKTLAEKVRQLLNGYVGLMGTVDVGHCRIVNEMDLPFEDEPEVYRVTQDYVLSHVES